MLVHQTLRSFALVVLVVLFPFLLFAQSKDNRFMDGCCVNPVFPRPKNVQRTLLPRGRVLEALNCATNNKDMDGTDSVAKSLGDPGFLHVAYFYGIYMPEQDGPALTIAIYSADEKHGWLMDIDWDGLKYFVGNLPELKKGRKAWRVSEINGGVWTYTRLWYLAQELGSSPHEKVGLNSIKNANPESCSVQVMLRSTLPTR
jgi:hypothetical protein